MNLKVKYIRWMLSLLIITLMAAGFIPGMIAGPVIASAPDDVPDAPTRGQASLLSFVEAQTNYVGGIALDATGKVWTWGYNSNGQLGIGVDIAQYAGGMTRIPFFVDNNINVAHIAGGFHTNFALTDSGELYAWGRGNNGQMGDGTSISANATPVKVTTLPDGIKIKKVAVGSGGLTGECCVYLLCEDGRVFAWGSGLSRRIPGTGSSTNSTAREVTEYFTSILPAGAKIVDIELGDAHAVALDSTGQVYTWGTNSSGQLGLGDMTFRDNPEKVTYFSGTSIKDISAFHNTTMAVTISGEAYIWGTTYEGRGTTTSYTRAGGDTIQYSSENSVVNRAMPRLVEFDLSSSPYNDTAPEVAFATAGQYVSYVTDIYGRSWYFGWNVFYGFMTDGPLFNTNDGGKHSTCVTDATLIRTLGDGDTQGYIFQVQAPVFSGAERIESFEPQYNSYRTHGQWSSMGDGLHPTIYDKKYMETTIEKDPVYPNRHTYDYPLDAQGRRLVYVIKRESESPTRYCGDFYVADETYTGPWCEYNIGTTDLPVGVSAETSVPVVKEDERTWIGLSVDLKTFDYTGRQLNEMPYITGISNNSSQVLFIDNSGNLYKQSNDGSGSIAWGWDYSKYESLTSGNNASEGLYNFYSYEIMYMRGAPNIAYPEITIEEPETKIYYEDGELGESPIDTVTISVKVHETVEDSQMNIEVEPELTGLQYVFIPYDPSDANFSNRDFSDKDFEAAYECGCYEAGDLLEEGQVYKEGEYSFSVDIGCNGKIWVLAKDVVYTFDRYRTAEYVADNFYSPLLINHRGVDYKNPEGEYIYPPTDDNVVKELKTYSPAYTDMSPVYGIPLDVEGSIIEDSTFGYDKVTVSRYEELPEDISEFWGWHKAQEESVDFILDDTKYMVIESGELVPYVYSFYYDFIGEALITADMDLTDASGDGYASPGEILTYTISINNGGNISAIDVAVQDTLDEMISYIYNPNANNVTVTGASIAPKTVGDMIAGFTIPEVSRGATVTLTFSVTVRTDIDVGAVKQLNNTAVVDGTEISAGIMTYKAGLKKSADPGAFAGDGDEIVYTVSFIMPDDLNRYDAVKIVDSVPAGLSYVADSAELKVGGAIGEAVPMSRDTEGNLYYELSGTKLIPLTGKKIELVLTFTVDGWTSGSITNTAELYFKPVGYNYPSVPDDDAAVTIRELPSDFSKTTPLTNYPRISGRKINYIMSFTAPGDLSAFESFRISDTIPDGLSYPGEEASLKIGDTIISAPTVDDSASGVISLTIPAALLSEGDTVELELTFETTNSISGTIKNTAQLYYTLIGYSEAFICDAEAEIKQNGTGGGTYEPTTVKLTAKKIVSGSDAVIVAGQFSFAVYDESGIQVATATNDAAGDIAFPEIKFDREGVYTFTIKETMTSGGGWAADLRVFTVTVTVTGNGNTLVATEKYPDDTPPIFHNQYRTGTATFELSKALVNEDGTTASTGEVFWVMLYVRSGDDWIEMGRYAVPANSGSTIIPDLEGGKTYQFVELKNTWYVVRSQVVTMNNSILGTSDRPSVAISVPALSQNIHVEILIRNEQIGPVEGQPYGGEPEEDPEIIFIEEEVPLAMFIESHFAYIVGYPDGTVRPEQNITRAEVATVFFRLLSDDLRAANWTQQNSFKDVDSSSWYNNAISVMSNMGIINGYADGTFRPNASITRAELAAIAARFARETWMMPISSRDFSDTAGHWAENDILYAAAIGWVNGYADGTFLPNRAITRAELMTMVNRMLKREPQEADDLLAGEMISWSDNADTSKWYYLAVQEATNSHIPEYKDGQIVSGLSFEYERWLTLLINRDWSQYENEWSTAYSG